MTRRKKSSSLEDVFEFVARLPWWGGVVAAIVLYLGFRAYANQITTLAGILQYILPAIFLAGAAASAWYASQRRSPVHGVTASSAVASLDGMTWQEFELLMGEAFRQKGYKLVELGGVGPDGGVDLVLLKGGEHFFVQCKQWKEFKVGAGVVRELYGVMAAKGAAGGFVVTSGRFTTDAQEFARGRNVALVDGDRLFAMLQSAKAGLRKGRAAPDAVSATVFADIPNAEAQCKSQWASSGHDAGM